MREKKHSLEYTKDSGFTLLELLLVIAIISVLAGLVIFSLKPTNILTDTKHTKVVRISSDINDAVEAYTIEHNGVYPFSTNNLAQTAYSVCKQGQSSGCDINIDTLVTAGYLPSVPVSDDAVGNNSGYMLKYTDKGVEVGPSNINCPVGYIGVPGNPLYQTEDFCVMKYEAKDVSSVATSQATGTPWVNITQTAAITSCSNLGSKYHLITNNEWMTIARNIEQVASNWSLGTVGNGYLYAGHNDSSPANALAASSNDAYKAAYTDGTTEALTTATNTASGESGSTGNQVRTHTLSNGQIIWDLAGNVWEWNNNVISCAAANCTSAEMPYDASPAEEIVELTNLVTYGQLSYDLLRPSNTTWNAQQGFGRVYTDGNTAVPSGNSHVLRRGGDNIGGLYAGVLSLNLLNAPSNSTSWIGFRCAANL